AADSAWGFGKPAFCLRHCNLSSYVSLTPHVLALKSIQQSNRDILPKSPWGERISVESAAGSV
ncbi:MAG: hypothetical protein ACRD5L_04500, partial [Bryobacteraceae bacterium]